MQCNI